MSWFPRHKDRPWKATSGRKRLNIQGRRLILEEPFQSPFVEKREDPMPRQACRCVGKNLGKPRTQPLTAIHVFSRQCHAYHHAKICTMAERIRATGKVTFLPPICAASKSNKNVSGASCINVSPPIATITFDQFTEASRVSFAKTLPLKCREFTDTVHEQFSDHLARTNIFF